MGLKRAFKYIVQYYDGDYEKALLWFGTKNPLLGDVAPLVMVVSGRSDKLCQFIQAQLKGYYP